MATSGVRGHGERLLLSANEVGTWGSVSLLLCLGVSDSGAILENGLGRERLPPAGRIPPTPASGLGLMPARHRVTDVVLLLFPTVTRQSNEPFAQHSPVNH